MRKCGKPLHLGYISMCDDAPESVNWSMDDGALAAVPVRSRSCKGRARRIVFGEAETYRHMPLNTTGELVPRLVTLKEKSVRTKVSRWYYFYFFLRKPCKRPKSVQFVVTHQMPVHPPATCVPAQRPILGNTRLFTLCNSPLQLSAVALLCSPTASADSR